MSSYTWEPVGASCWQHALPDGRQLEVRPDTPKRWRWKVSAGDEVPELNGWCRSFDAAKLRCILAWKDTARREHKAALTIDAINHLTRPEPTCA